MEKLPIPEFNRASQLHVSSSISRPPSPLSRGSLDRLAILHNRAQAGLRREEIDEGEVQALERRREAVGASLRHREDTAVASALGSMFVVMKIPQGSETDWEIVIASYARALSDLPSWAVVQACEMIVKGGGANKTFAPSAPEIREIAERIVEPIEFERSKIGSVLAALAKPSAAVTAAELEKVGGKIAALRADMQADADAERAKDKALHVAQVERANEAGRAAIVAECEAAGVEPFADGAKTIPVSMALRTIVAAKPAIDDGARDVA